VYGVETRKDIGTSLQEICQGNIYTLHPPFHHYRFAAVPAVVCPTSCAVAVVAADADEAAVGAPAPVHLRPLWDSSPLGE
tara:strand:- start:663 stop:902 length:240 start_codon:yes stop_codon:yes gene_type:complete